MKKELFGAEDTCCEEEIICPYCGQIQIEPQEYESGIWDCGECGEEFELDVEVSVTYSTYRVKSKE